MEIVLLSDVHLLNRKPDRRTDNILEEQWNKLEFVFSYCENNSSMLFQAGDLFDKPRDWNTLDRFIELRKKYPKFKIFLVSGQHDMYQRNTGIVCNLSILNELNMVHLLKEDAIIHGANVKNQLDIRFFSFGEVPENHPGIMVIHAPISDSSLFPGMEYTSAKAFLKKYDKYDLILCGDVHKPFIVEDKKGRMIVNTGPMIRKSIAEDNDPLFYVYNTDYKTIKTVQIPHKPFEDVFRVEKEQKTKEILEDFIKEILDYEAKGTDILRNIHDFIEKNDLSDDVKQTIYRVMQEKT